MSACQIPGWQLVVAACCGNLLWMLLVQQNCLCSGFKRKEGGRGRLCTAQEPVGIRWGQGGGQCQQQHRQWGRICKEPAFGRQPPGKHQCTDPFTKQCKQVFLSSHTAMIASSRDMCIYTIHATMANLSLQMCEAEEAAARALTPEGPVDEQSSTSCHADMQVRPSHSLAIPHDIVSGLYCFHCIFLNCRVHAWQP